MPKKKRASTRKKKIEEKSEPEITDEMEAELISNTVGYGDTEGSVPLEDMPLSMQKELETTEITELGAKKQEEESLIPSGFDVAEPIKKVVDLGPPTHYGCGGAMTSHGSDGRGYWWECAKCRSQLYFRSLRQRGPIGNPSIAHVRYKVDSRPKKGRRLT